MVVIKLKWKKWGVGKEYASCWFCGSPTLYFLTGTKEKYFEVFCCKKCKKKHGKIYRRKGKTEKHPTNKNKTKKFANTKGKKKEKLYTERTTTQMRLRDILNIGGRKYNENTQTAYQLKIL